MRIALYPSQEAQGALCHGSGYGGKYSSLGLRMATETGKTFPLFISDHILLSLVDPEREWYSSGSNDAHFCLIGPGTGTAMAHEKMASSIYMYVCVYT